MSEPFVCIFDFNGFSDRNPLVKACIERTKSLYNGVHVYTEKDLMQYIEKLPHSKFHYDLKNWSFIGDQLRLYLATLHENFLYVDADVYIRQKDKIIPNSIGYPRNEGTYFWKVGNNEFVNHYLKWYTENSECRLPNVFCHKDGFFDMKCDMSSHTCFHFHFNELQNYKKEALPEKLRVPFEKQLEAIKHQHVL